MNEHDEYVLTWEEIANTQAKTIDKLLTEIKRLRAENGELKQQLIDVDYVPSISELRRKNEALQAELLRVEKILEEQSE